MYNLPAMVYNLTNSREQEQGENMIREFGWKGFNRITVVDTEKLTVTVVNSEGEKLSSPQPQTEAGMKTLVAELEREVERNRMVEM